MFELCLVPSAKTGKLSGIFLHTAGKSEYEVQSSEYLGVPGDL